MKIIEWNCQGAFRKKNEQILSLKPDILIIPECENEEKLKFDKLTPKPNDFFWYGDSSNKGIGVFSYSDYKFEILNEFNPKYRYVIPLKVSNKQNSFILFAIWAMDNKEKKDARYIGQIWLAINYYSDFLINEKTILIGDFNSNQIWDYKDRVGNHMDVVRKLEEKQIFSLYHKKYSLEYGNEKDATFYMYRKKEKPYHIDYCFASNKILQKGFDLEIEKNDNWINFSDHKPMIIELSDNINQEEILNSLKKGIESKINIISVQTKEKFTDLIEWILKEAEEFDNNPQKKAIEKQKIIDNFEMLLEIDKMIILINKNIVNNSSKK